MPVVEIPPALSRYSDERPEVSVAGQTVEAVLADLWRQYPELESRVLDGRGEVFPYLLLFLNGDKLPRSAFGSRAVAETDRLEIVALAEGG